jgi:hypothetical protein
LPPPIHPDANDEVDYHGTLSDFSDYQSSDEETHAIASPLHPTAYVNPAYDQYVQSHDSSKNTLIDLGDDPFADPGEPEVGTPGISPRKQYV